MVFRLEGFGQKGRSDECADLRVQDWRFRSFKV